MDVAAVDANESKEVVTVTPLEEGVQESSLTPLESDV